MDFGFSQQDEDFRKEVKAFLDREFTPEAVAEIDTGWGPGPATRQLYNKLGAKGWLTIS